MEVNYTIANLEIHYKICKYLYDNFDTFSVSCFKEEQGEYKWNKCHHTIDKHLVNNILMLKLLSS